MFRLAVLLALATACAAPQKTTQTAAKGSGSRSQPICHEVNDTGSMFSHTECTTPEEQSQSSEDTERVMRRTTGTAATPPPSGRGR